MIKIPRIVTAAAVALTISACSGNEAPDADNVTETQMDDVDVIDGTISDEMVDVDTMAEVDATGVDEEDASDKKEEPATGDESEAAKKPAE